MRMTFGGFERRAQRSGLAQDLAWMTVCLLVIAAFVSPAFSGPSLRLQDEGIALGEPGMVLAALETAGAPAAMIESDSPQGLIEVQPTQGGARVGADISKWSHIKRAVANNPKKTITGVVSGLMGGYLLFADNNSKWPYNKRGGAGGAGAGGSTAGTTIPSMGDNNMTIVVSGNNAPVNVRIGNNVED